MYDMTMDIDRSHPESVVPAGKFEERCLALLDQVSETGISIVVTKRGRPVARVVPIDSSPRSLAGSVRLLTTDEEDLFTADRA